MDRTKKGYIDLGRKRIEKNRGYSMTMDELRSIASVAFNEDIVTAIGYAYYMGVEAGARMTSKGRC